MFIEIIIISWVTFAFLFTVILSIFSEDKFQSNIFLYNLGTSMFSIAIVLFFISFMIYLMISIHNYINRDKIKAEHEAWKKEVKDKKIESFKIKKEFLRNMKKLLKDEDFQELIKFYNNDDNHEFKDNILKRLIQEKYEIKCKIVKLDDNIIEDVLIGIKIGNSNYKYKYKNEKFYSSFKPKEIINLNK